MERTTLFGNMDLLQFDSRRYISGGHVISADIVLDMDMLWIGTMSYFYMTLFMMT